MPNGGIKPSCKVCKWAIKDENPTIDPIKCAKHSFIVSMPLTHVCQSLDGDGGLASFAEVRKLQAETMYAWLKFPYIDPKHPNLPKN